MIPDGFSAFTAGVSAATRRGLLELKRLLVVLDAAQTTLSTALTALTTRVTALELFKTNTEAGWTSFTPQLDQGVTTNIAKTVNYSKYKLVGKTVIWQFALSVGANGTAGTFFSMTLPVASVTATNLDVGPLAIFDNSASTRYTGHGETTAGGTKLLMISDVTATDGWGGVPSLAIQTGDLIRGTATYEVA